VPILRRAGIVGRATNEVSVGRVREWAAVAGVAVGLGAGLAAWASRRRQAAPLPPAPPPPEPPAPGAPADPTAALDAARARLRARADELRAEIEGEPPPTEA